MIPIINNQFQNSENIFSSTASNESDLIKLEYKMKRTLLFILLLSTLLLISCNGVYHSSVVGNGDTIKKEISAAEFSTVDASHAFDIRIVVGNKTSVSVETDENIIEYVKVYVKNNTLYLGIENNININGTIKATISTPELDKVDLSGACKINVDGINTDKFAIDMSGACKGNFSGMTDKLDIDLSGATKINSIDLIAEDVKIDVSGASKCEIYSSVSLFANASGASKIITYGNPPNVETDISGASAINFK